MQKFCDTLRMSNIVFRASFVSLLLWQLSWLPFGYPLTTP